MFIYLLFFCHVYFNRFEIYLLCEFIAVFILKIDHWLRLQNKMLVDELLVFVVKRLFLIEMTTLFLD